MLLIGSERDCPDIEYMTGFRTAGSVVFLQKGRDKYLVVPQFELGRATRISWTAGLAHTRREAASNSLHCGDSTGRSQVRLFTPEELGLGTQGRRRVSEWTLRLLQRLDIRAVTVPPFFPHGVARRLERAGIHLALATGELFPERAVKSAKELCKIKESQQAAVIAMRMAVEMITGSQIDNAGYLRLKDKHLTSEQVRRAIIKVLLEHDSFCREPIVAGGIQAADPHEIGKGPLRAHEAVVIDIFPQHLVHGYWGDLTRTVVKGSPPRELKRMYHAVKAAQAVALSRIKPGVKCASVHKSVVEEFSRCGFDAAGVGRTPIGFTHSTGHGVGLAIHEAPSIAAGDGQLRTGNVITVEPGLYYPEIGGVRIEDTVVVTPTGWRYLVPCEKKFEI